MSEAAQDRIAELERQLWHAKNDNGDILIDQYERAVAAENRVALLEHLVAVQDKVITAERDCAVYSNKLILCYLDLLTAKQKQKAENYAHERYQMQLLTAALHARAELQSLLAGMAMEKEVGNV